MFVGKFVTGGKNTKKTCSQKVRSYFHPQKKKMMFESYGRSQLGKKKKTYARKLEVTPPGKERKPPRPGVNS